MAPRVDVHGGDDEECRCKTDSVEQNEFGNFSRRADLTSEIAAPIAGECSKQEFQGIHIKENDEQKKGIERKRCTVFQRVAAKEFVMRVPEQ